LCDFKTQRSFILFLEIVTAPFRLLEFQLTIPLQDRYVVSFRNRMLVTKMTLQIMPVIQKAIAKIGIRELLLP
jgi:hypothetical protein